jgi:cell division transport system ATP-binding protein
MLFGAEAPTSGHGVVNGRNLARLDTATVAALRREIGLVFQDPRLIERLPVVENVALAAEVAGESRVRALARAEEMLETFELRALSDALPCVLSAGDRQRVGLARALVNRPVLLIADEPTGNLDPDATEQIVAHLKRVHDDGTTVFIATHDESALALLDCRALMMCGGRVFEEDDARLASSL